MTSPLELMGAPGSPYTRKMVALLRYRRIPYQVSWAAGRPPKPGYPVPKVPLLPTFYYPDGEGGMMAVTDSTPIIRRLESEHEGCSVIPSDPVLSFLNDLIEDYADEWLTKAMFHFRWAHKADYDCWSIGRRTRWMPRVQARCQTQFPNGSLTGSMSSGRMTSQRRRSNPPMPA